jgi:hypothetical protein
VRLLSLLLFELLLGLELCGSLLLFFLLSKLLGLQELLGLSGLALLTILELELKLLLMC